MIIYDFMFGNYLRSLDKLDSVPINCRIEFFFNIHSSRKLQRARCQLIEIFNSSFFVMNFMNNVFRFAPSPTGHLHLGGLRTALFNFVYAKKLGASFKLRIDDTDSARLVPGSVDSILEDLDWAGIQFDPPHPVWRQSDRYHIYRSMAEQLVLKGFAYRCYCSGACTSANCTQNQASVYPQGLSGGSFITCCEQNKTVGKRTQNSYAIRLFTSRMIEILQKGNLLTFHDLIYGPITVDLRLIGSPVLLKSNGAPTYHLCGPIDDHDMGVTTVMRGQEWLPSTPLHILVYLAFNWDPPKFAHLPLLCDIHGKKLSKRNNHSFVSHYRKHGIVPQALLNFLMLQGWSLGSSLGPKEGTSNPIFMQKSNDFDKNKVFESMVPLNEGLGDLVRGKSINEVHTIDEIIPHVSLTDLMEIFLGIISHSIFHHNFLIFN